MLEESRGTATGGAHAERGEAPLPPDLSFHPHSHSASVAGEQNQSRINSQSRMC